jgi:tRNA threonylcarbamoyladenosine biosynthesis protein TsaE
MTSERLAFVTESPEATVEFGARLGACLEGGDVLGLTGTLGAGKTCLVKGLARGLGVPDELRVTSPSFVLMRRYEGRLTLYHFDAYRLANADEMEEIGCQEVFDAGGVSAVEWADHVAACLPPEHFLLTLRVAGRERRELTLEAIGLGQSCRNLRLQEALAPWAKG